MLPKESPLRVVATVPPTLVSLIRLPTAYGLFPIPNLFNDVKGNPPAPPEIDIKGFEVPAVAPYGASVIPPSPVVSFVLTESPTLPIRTLALTAIEVVVLSRSNLYVVPVGL